MWRRGLFRLGLLAGLAGFAFLGFVSWDVTVPIQWVCHRLGVNTNGLEVTVAQAKWIPWRRLELTDLKLHLPQSGRLHLVKVTLSSQPWTLIGGHLTTQWQLGAMRIDPGSWGIHRSLAQEILSSRPVTTDGFAILEYQFGKLILRQMTLHGPLLRLHAEGWFDGGRRANLALRGELLRTLLESMKLVKSDQENVEPWEPFELQVDGALARPQVQFRSSFFTFAMDPPVEEKS